MNIAEAIVIIIVISWIIIGGIYGLLNMDRIPYKYRIDGIRTENYVENDWCIEFIDTYNKYRKICWTYTIRNK